MEMSFFGLADGDGNSITRGLQLPLAQARALAQSYADDRGAPVDLWDESEKSEDGEPVASLETFYPALPRIASEDTDCPTCQLLGCDHGSICGLGGAEGK